MYYVISKDNSWTFSWTNIFFLYTEHSVISRTYAHSSKFIHLLLHTVPWNINRYIKHSVNFSATNPRTFLTLFLYFVNIHMTLFLTAKKKKKKQNCLCSVHLCDPSSLIAQALFFSANFSLLRTILILFRWCVCAHKHALQIVLPMYWYM